MAYNFKIWWVGAYRVMGGFWNEYGSRIYTEQNTHALH